MRKSKIFISWLLIVFFTISCQDISDSKYSTFEQDTVTSFLRNYPETYSEFLKFLEKADMIDLLSAYGTYTCFAPTNEAFQKYYVEKNTSFDQMSQDEFREIAFSHILGKTLKSIDFPLGVVPDANLYEQFISISYGTGDNSSIIYVNENARIVRLDQDVHNGIVHTIDAVMEPAKIQVPEIIASKPQFFLFSEALYLTKLADSLRLVKDYDYVQHRVNTRLSTADLGSNWITPPFLKFGYTVFVESDSLYKVNGISNIDDLKKYAAEVYDKMYSGDKDVTDVTDRRNSLNRFISYHIMDRMQAENEFFPPTIVRYFIPGLEMREYVEMMCPNTLLEVSKAPNEVLINKHKNGDAIRIITPNITTENGLIHEIDKILVYDETVENDVLNKKLRVDAGSMLPELATNKIRQMDYCMFLLPQGYVRNLIFSEETEVFYKVNSAWANIGGDEIILGGKYDFTLRIPPIPAGTYEIRFRYNSTGVGSQQRSVAQLYLDGKICGIPLDLRIDASEPKIGWMADSNTDDQGLENDKMMRNRGYMKDINTTYLGSAFSTIARNSSGSIRKILVTQTFTKTEPHFLRVKSVEERIAEFQLDYLEFVPIHLIATEGKD